MEYELIAMLALLRTLRDPRIMRHLMGEEEFDRRNARREERRRKASMSWAEKRIERMEKNKRKAAYERAWRARKRAERSSSAKAAEDKQKGQER